MSHPMEDYVFAQFKQVDGNELGLFAVFDGHLSQEVPDYLRSHLFDNIINEPNFWTDPEEAIRKAYKFTDSTIMNKAIKKRKGGSTAVTAILINCETLVVANVGDSRAVLCQDGVAKQLSVDHEPNKERKVIEEKGGFVTKFPGDCPRVDGSLAMSRSFGDKRLKEHVSSEPDVCVEEVDDDTEFLILASDGVWKVMSNQEAVDCVKDVEDPRLAAKHLIKEALKRKSRDDISCIVVRFHFRPPPNVQVPSMPIAALSLQFNAAKPGQGKQAIKTCLQFNATKPGQGKQAIMTLRPLH
ncbi:Protein phosphatase 2C [Artemisia annua]|uniref:protein-serine/threonine phosphatase n=1 Tax=Artemisia annua TaxID=35608 RepID=A0A2U1NRF4_ARTAN|nr:Protein phosphatase 2C [Artemisia annua]